MSRTHFLKLPNGLKIILNKNPKLSPDSINSVNLNQSLSQIEVNQGNVSEKNCVAPKLKALFHSHKALFEADKGNSILSYYTGINYYISIKLLSRLLSDEMNH